MISFKRGKRKTIADYKTQDIYKHYKIKCKERNLEPVPYGKFAKILRVFNENRINLVIMENIEFHMPFRTGSIRVKKKEVKIKIKDNGDVDKRNLSINWKKTKEYWMKQYPNLTSEEIKEIPNKKLIYELNEHTDGFRFIYYWDKITCNIKNQSAYSFTATRTNKEKLTVALKTIRNLNYYE